MIHIMVAASPDALFIEAIRYLTGDGVSRDVPRARTLLRSAADRGHDEAALFEVALAANGSGAPQDWSGALARLRATAQAGSAVAHMHLTLIDAMNLDERGYPATLPQPARLAGNPSVLRYPALFTPAECQLIASAVVDILEPSTVIDPQTGRLVAHPIRTSDSAVIGPTRESLPIAALNRRIAAASNTAVAQGESLAVLRYRPGGEYRLHHDALPNARNQRTKTALIYLNSGYAGGETVFPDLPLHIAGKAGDVVVFDNLDENGRPQPSARHAGQPVRGGVKWLATRWIRQRNVDPWDPATWQ